MSVHFPHQPLELIPLHVWHALSADWRPQGFIQLIDVLAEMRHDDDDRHNKGFYRGAHYPLKEIVAWVAAMQRFAPELAETVADTIESRGMFIMAAQEIQESPLRLKIDSVVLDFFAGANKPYLWIDGAPYDLDKVWNGISHRSNRVAIMSFVSEALDRFTMTTPARNEIVAQLGQLSVAKSSDPIVVGQGDLFARVFGASGTLSRDVGSVDLVATGIAPSPQSPLSWLTKEVQEELTASWNYAKEVNKRSRQARPKNPITPRSGRGNTP